MFYFFLFSFGVGEKGNQSLHDKEDIDSQQSHKSLHNSLPALFNMAVIRAMLVRPISKSLYVYRKKKIDCIIIYFLLKSKDYYYFFLHQPDNAF